MENSEYLALLAAAVPLVLLAIVWLRWSRSRRAYENRLAAASTEQSVSLEKLRSQQAVAERLTLDVAQWREATRGYQERVEVLAAANAALEVRVQRIPVLENELTEVKGQVVHLGGDLRRESSALAQAVEKSARLQAVEAEKSRKEEQIAVLQQQLSQLKAQMAELSTILDEERKQANEKIALLNEARDHLKNEFQNLAQKIFEEKSARFADQNQTAMDRLIVPLREQIGDFKKRVEDVYDKESRDRTALHAEINHLKELNQRISKEAVNLTRALKGDSKARGNWGEVILERVLEASGLQKGREYDVQVSLRDPEGRRYQPDAVVRLPEGKDVIVDAKVSLKDYEAFFGAESPEEKERYLTAHVEAVRAHLRGLAAKRYEALEGVRTLDFTLMFVPIEAAFLAAVEKDGALFAEAFEKNIMVVSPSTLLVTLRTIQNIWRHEYQNRNAQEIAKKAGGLYEKFVGFVEALEEVGRQLDKARDAYRLAHDRLAAGKGNLVRRSQELKELGVKAGKELPQKLIEETQSDETGAV
jgi:DNA recombination protein RmuC